MVYKQDYHYLHRNKNNNKSSLVNKNKIITCIHLFDHSINFIIACESIQRQELCLWTMCIKAKWETKQ